MQYLHLVYLSDQKLQAVDRDERCRDAACVRRLALRRLGCEPGGGSTLRFDGIGLVTDGPFVETKEYRL